MHLTGYCTEPFNCFCNFQFNINEYEQDIPSVQGVNAF